MQATNDPQIRELLLPFVRNEHGTSETIYIEEFALYGGANRADLAALNGVSHGYEIKSDKDTLLRLPQQVDAYNAVFERATLVSGVRHLSAALNMIPRWWGVVEVRSHQDSTVFLERVRESRPNPEPHGEAIASLLWRPEALHILTSLGLDKGVRSKPMEHLIARLAAELSPEKLSRIVRETLRARGDWRAAARLRRYDAKSPRLSNQSRSQRIFAENTGL
ncbi:MAG: sce7726 family protein [Acidobacteriia bacterium]|nr:sce7726 family protein [Terriglobia bacterium]